MSDEAVRKEFEAWAKSLPVAEPDETKRDDIGHYKYSDVAYGWLAWQASRAAAIQECADKMRAMNHPAYADMILLALKER